MKSGRLRQRVQIQKLTFGTPDPVTGHPGTETWVNVFSSKVPAEVLEGPGREPYMAGTIQAETTARINLRWFSTTKHALMKMRILWEGRVFNIISAETDATGRREWRLRCQDGVDDG